MPESQSIEGLSEEESQESDSPQLTGVLPEVEAVEFDQEDVCPHQQIPACMKMKENS